MEPQACEANKWLYWLLVLIEIAQQFRDVTTLIRDTQNIDMVGALHVQNRIREVLQRPSPGDIELVAVARRTDARVLAGRGASHGS
jgi:hypothetical protein